MASTDKLIRIVLRLEDQMSGQLDSVSSKMQNIGQQMTRVGGMMTAGITLPVIGLGREMFTTFADFESIMKELEVRTGASARAMEAMSEAAKEAGRTTMFSATEAGQALVELASSGSTASESMEMLDDVLNLATAGSLDLKTAADGVTDILAQFQLEAESATYVVDQLAAASGSSSATVQDMIDAFANAGPVANQFGLSVHETSAALALFAEAGVKGSEAGTQLRSMLLNMTRNTDTTKDAWEELGVSMFDSAGNMRAIDDVFKDINDAMEDLPMEDQIRLSQALAGTYGITGFNALLAADGIGEMSEAILDSNNAAFMANEMMDTMDGALAKLRAAWEGLMITLGELGSGAFVDFVDWLAEIINKLTVWIEQNPKLAQGIMLFVAALATLGPILIILGSIISAIGTIAGALSALTLGPIGLMILAASALFLAWQTNLFGIRTLAENVFGTIKQIISTLLLGDFIGGGFLSEDHPIVSFLLDLRELFMEAPIWAKAAMTAIGIALLTAMGPITALIAALAALKVALNFWETSGASEQWDYNMRTLGTIIERGTARALEAAKNFSDDFPGHMQNTWDELHRQNNRLGAFLSRTVDSLAFSFRTIGRIFNEIGGRLMQGLINGVRQKIDEFIDLVVNMAQSVANAVSDVLQIRSPSKVMMDIGVNTVEGFEKGLDTFAGINKAMFSPSVNSVPVASGAGTGGNFIMNGNIVAAPGTTDQQVEDIARKLAKRVNKRGNGF